MDAFIIKYQVTGGTLTFMFTLTYEYNKVSFASRSIKKHSMAVTATCQAVKRDLDFSEEGPLGMPNIGKAEQQSHYACN